jgi:hypothetical protein
MKKMRKTIEKHLFKNNLIHTSKIVQNPGDMAKMCSILYVYSMKVYMLCLKLLHIILKLNIKLYNKEIIETLRVMRIYKSLSLVMNRRLRLYNASLIN